MAIAETPQQAARRLARPMLDKGFKPEALFTYTDCNGGELYHKVRARHPETREKWIRPIRRNGARYELGEPDFPEGKPLYRLRDLAARPADACWYVEGENCVDALAKLGLLATTAGSASSDEKADFSPLAGREVVVWPDNDQPGIEHAQRVATKLRAFSCKAEIIDVAALGLPDKGDVVDWIKAHPNATAADLASLPRLPGVSAEDAADGRRTIELIGWPDPQPLPNQLPAVSPFSLDLLPDDLRGWIGDIADRVQCAPEFPAVAAIVALGSAIGRSLAVRPKERDDWEEFPNLWGVIIGSPGVLKTPALMEALRPLRALEAKALEAHGEAATAWRAEREAARVRRAAAFTKAKKAAGKGGEFDAAALVLAEDDQEPQPRRYIVNDCSVEALGEVLMASPNGILAYRDELIGLLKSLDREGMEGARAFYLSAYSGKEPHVFDRIGRGLNLRIDHCCVSMLGSIQPSVIGRYLREAFDNGGDDGLLSRFSLLVWPDVSGPWRNVDRWPDTVSRKRAAALFERVNALDPQAIGAELEEGRAPFLRFDAAALAEFVEWRERFEGQQRDAEAHPAIVAHFAKYRKLIPALALIFHLAGGGSGPITKAALLRALAWQELLQSHARRAYASIQQARTEAARALLAKIRTGAVGDPLQVRDVYLKGWSGLASPEEARRAVELLEELDYLRSELLPTPGRPKTVYWTNPKARA